ncbi:unnamed protein product [Urochloa decumbens]|uniref:BTB domain-containing protein n=1 Tax=Urochloa decumbens TaxID=240449 RepID=A0ABC9GAL9_9POAL
MPPPPSPSPSPVPCSTAITMTIGSYAEAKKLPNGRSIMSDPISAGGHLWRTAFCPNGNLMTGTNGSTMSLFLLMDDTGVATDEEAVNVKFSFTIRDDDGGGSSDLITGEVAAAFSCQWNAHGFEHFLSRECLEKLTFIESDRFVIRCDLTVYPAGSPQPGPSGAKAEPLLSSTMAAPPPALTEPPVIGPKVPRLVRARSSPALGRHTELGRLHATKEGADVEIEVCGKVFAAHKTVLAARSPVFREDFFGPAKEKDTSFVRIGDMRPEVFEALLNYMYTDSLPDQMAMSNSLEQKGAVLLAEDLLVAADRYGVKGLKSLIEDKLCSHVGVSTVLLMLELAEKYQCCKVKKKCLGFIGSGPNARAVVAGNDFENLARSCPSVVKDVIMEILDTREERSKRLVNICIYAFCFILPFLVFAVFNKQ